MNMIEDLIRRSKFHVGDRVIVKPCTDVSDIMAGYYGHVHTVAKVTPKGQIILVSLEGRVGKPVYQKDLDLTGDDPFIFYDNEIEHAD